MADEAEKDGGELAKSWLKQHRKPLLAGAMTIALLGGLGAWALHSFLNKPVQPATPAVPTVGIVDVQRAMQVHPVYGELAKVREEAKALAADIEMDKAYLEQLAIRPPAVQPEPFDKMAEKQALHKNVMLGAHYQAQRQAAAKEWEERNRPEYDRVHDKVDGAYLNAILNIRLKLDNREVMRLSDEDVADLQAQLEKLQQERGADQKRLWEEYQSALSAYLDAFDEQNKGKLLQAQAETVQREQAAEAARQTAAQQRNIEAMKENLAGQERAQKLLAKRTALIEKETEARTMEAHILNDVASKAAKLAILHHLTLIVANPVQPLASLDFGSSVDFAPSAQPQLVPTIGIDVMDLTDELLREME